ncbi:MAG: hypothetical protein AB1801_11980 [Chloroflexota bacterium]
MERLMLILIGSLMVVALYLTVTVTALGLRQLEPVQADVPSQAVVAAQEEVYYLPLTDAQPGRDITQQRFAPPQ